MRDEGLIVVALLLFAFSRSKKTRDWSDDEMRAFIDTIKPIGIPLDAVLAVWASESGLNPSASSGVAWGMNQAQGPLLKAAGFTGTPSSFASLDVKQQLPYLARMLQIQIRAIGYTPESDLDLYVANFSPAAAKTRSFKIYDGSVPGQRSAYLSNRQLDADNKGYISSADLGRVLARTRNSALFKRAVAQLWRLYA